MKYNCLIVDDETAIAQSTCEYFNLFDVTCAHAADADGCMSFFKENEAEVILLDINLGNDSGFRLCKRLRERLSVPILFISARSSEDDMLVALNIGGDDYIQKPYSLSVLLAKVKAVLKRCGTGEKSSQVLSSGAITVDLNAQRVTCGTEEIKLKTMEYSLLVYLMQSSGRTVPKEELFRNVWKDTITGDGTLNVHIRRLREKIEQDPNNPVHIRTVWGVGYAWEAGE